MPVAGDSSPEQRHLPLTVTICRILEESRQSQATHSRKLKELAGIHRSTASKPFFESFVQAIGPIFDFPRRTVTAERTVRFIAGFAALRLESKGCEDGNEIEVQFLEEFLRFLVVGSQAAHRPARFRASQIISEIIMRLPDDAEVSDDVWDEVIEAMKERAGDKIPAIRAFAVRALSRFAFGGDDTDVSDMFLELLPMEQNAEVRKAIVLSLPSSSSTIEAVIESTLDVSESVRKAAYCVVASKFPLQSLSIKHRTTLLKRGLKDRSSVVKTECLTMLKDSWLTKFCEGNIIKLLKYLDVETYESVAEAVLDALLNDRAIKVQDGQTIRQYIIHENHTEGEITEPRIELMDAETALYWRVVCKHLQAEAQAKGSDAATTTGTEAAVYASEASDKNDLLEGVLPASISDYVSLVNAHLSAGQSQHFTSRQLLLLGSQLDFSDSSTRKSASSFLLSLLSLPPHQSPLATSAGDQPPLATSSGDGSDQSPLATSAAGDGFSLGGDRAWARAVAELARRVHASKGEFEAVVCGAVEARARPVRERVGGFGEWVHCLGLVGFLLENLEEGEGLWGLRGKAVQGGEILRTILLPAAKQTHIDIQRSAMRQLGLFGSLETKPSADLIKQLQNSFINGSAPVSSMACKSLLDLVTWFGPNEINKSLGFTNSDEPKTHFNTLNVQNSEGEACFEVLDLLYWGFGKEEMELGFEGEEEEEEEDEEDCVVSVLGEGFAKLLLLSENYASVSEELCCEILSKLVKVYFSEETGDLKRLKQCLSMFFEHYPAVSRSHKRCVSSAFIPVMRSMWPSMFGNIGGSSMYISKMRKRAVTAARFMLQMIQTPLFSNQNEESLSDDDFDCDEEGLAIRISAEVASCSEKTTASKAYISALCKILVMLRFRVSEQKAIKCMRGMINLILASVSHDKDGVKEIAKMGMSLKSLDQQENEELAEDQINAIFAKLGIDPNFQLDTNPIIPPTPTVPSAKPAPPSRARSRRKPSSPSSSDADVAPLQPLIATPVMASRRTERASKAAALSRMAESSAVQKALESDEERSESGVVDEESESEGDFE